jgi:peptidoglycan hydrolase CwlO-like protein
MTDRSRYRMREDSKLFEDAKYNPTAELAIVLAERLEEVQFEFDEQLEEAKERAADFERDANHLDDKIYELQQKIDVLELMLSQRDETIEELRKGN